jgi:hypothetical protein
MYWHNNLEHKYIDSALDSFSLKDMNNLSYNILEKMGGNTVSSIFSYRSLVSTSFNQFPSISSS